MEVDYISSFFLKNPLLAFNLLTKNDNSCRRIEQVLGKDLVSGSVL